MESNLILETEPDGDSGVDAIRGTGGGSNRTDPKERDTGDCRVDPLGADDEGVRPRSTGGGIGTSGGADRSDKPSLWLHGNRVARREILNSSNGAKVGDVVEVQSSVKLTRTGDRTRGKAAPKCNRDLWNGPLIKKGSPGGGLGVLTQIEGKVCLRKRGRGDRNLRIKLDRVPSNESRDVPRNALRHVEWVGGTDGEISSVFRLITRSRGGRHDSRLVLSRRSAFGSGHAARRGPRTGIAGGSKCGGNAGTDEHRIHDSDAYSDYI
jgi:hypothetical protein